MRYLSVCSGIEAATAAWHPLGWEPVAFSEIEKFPSAVLAHHYPNVPNWGDMTKFQEWPDATVDVLVGGTPCQSFSVAGLRKGLADPRGNLALTYLAIADRYRPTWLVWENVPGVLSADGGRAFGAILGGMAELGYGFAYRILDAQYVRTCRYPGAVPQRRRRVFVVARIGDWRRAAAVLFDAESLSGNPPPRREAGEKVAPSVTSGPPFSRTGNERVECEAILPQNVSAPLGAGDGQRGFRNDLDQGAFIPECAPTIPSRSTAGGGLGTDFDCDGGTIPEVANPLTHRMHKGINTTLDEGQTPIPVAFHNRQDPDISGDVTHPLGSMDNGMAVAFSCKDYGADAGESAPTLRAMGHDGSHANAGGQLAVATTMAVRRLLPEECEALQGFPRGFTRIPWRGKEPEDCPDGNRYKALGNSMAVNCMEWLGQRIQMVSDLAPPA